MDGSKKPVVNQQVEMQKIRIQHIVVEQFVRRILNKPHKLYSRFETRRQGCLWDLIKCMSSKYLAKIELKFAESGGELNEVKFIAAVKPFLSFQKTRNVVGLDSFDTEYIQWYTAHRLFEDIDVNCLGYISWMQFIEFIVAKSELLRNNPKKMRSVPLQPTPLAVDLRPHVLSSSFPRVFCWPDKCKNVVLIFEEKLSSIKMLEATTGKEIKKLDGHVASPISAECFPSHFDLIATGSVDSTVIFWDSKGSFVRKWILSQSFVKTLAESKGIFGSSNSIGGIGNSKPSLTAIATQNVTIAGLISSPGEFDSSGFYSGSFGSSTNKDDLAIETGSISALSYRLPNDTLSSETMSGPNAIKSSPVVVTEALYVSAAVNCAKRFHNNFSPGQIHYVRHDNQLWIANHSTPAIRIYAMPPINIFKVPNTSEPNLIGAWGDSLLPNGPAAANHMTAFRHAAQKVRSLNMPTSTSSFPSVDSKAKHDSNTQKKTRSHVSVGTGKSIDGFTNIMPNASAPSTTKDVCLAAIELGKFYQTFAQKRKIRERAHENLTHGATTAAELASAAALEAQKSATNGKGSRTASRNNGKLSSSVAFLPSLEEWSTNAATITYPTSPEMISLRTPPGCDTGTQRFAEMQFSNPNQILPAGSDFDPCAPHAGTITAIVSSSVLDMVVTGGSDGRLAIWDSGRFVPTMVAFAHGRAISSLAICEKNRLVISCSYDGCIHFWDPYAGVRIGGTVPVSRALVRMIYIQSSQEVLALDVDGSIRIWDASQLNSEKGLALDPTTFVTTSQGNQAQDFTLTSNSSVLVTGKQIEHFTRQPECPSTAHAESCKAVLDIGRSLQLATVHSSVIRLWNALTGAPIADIANPHPDPIAKAVIDPNQRRIAVFSTSGQGSILNLSSGGLIRRLSSTFSGRSSFYLSSLHWGPSYLACFSANDRTTIVIPDDFRSLIAGAKAARIEVEAKVEANELKQLLKSDGSLLINQDALKDNVDGSDDSADIDLSKYMVARHDLIKNNPQARIITTEISDSTIFAPDFKHSIAVTANAAGEKEIFRLDANKSVFIKRENDVSSVSISQNQQVDLDNKNEGIKPNFLSSHTPIVGGASLTRSPLAIFVDEIGNISAVATARPLNFFSPFLSNLALTVPVTLRQAAFYADHGLNHMLQFIDEESVKLNPPSSNSNHNSPNNHAVSRAELISQDTYNNASNIREITTGDSKFHGAGLENLLSFGSGVTSELHSPKKEAQVGFTSNTEKKKINFSLNTGVTNNSVYTSRMSNFDKDKTPIAASAAFSDKSTSAHENSTKKTLSENNNNKNNAENGDLNLHTVGLPSQKLSLEFLLNRDIQTLNKPGLQPHRAALTNLSRAHSDLLNRYNLSLFPALHDIKMPKSPASIFLKKTQSFANLPSLDKGSRSFSLSKPITIVDDDFSHLTAKAKESTCSPVAIVSLHPGETTQNSSVHANNDSKLLPNAGNDKNDSSNFFGSEVNLDTNSNNNNTVGNLAVSNSTLKKKQNVQNQSSSFIIPDENLVSDGVARDAKPDHQLLSDSSSPTKDNNLALNSRPVKINDVPAIDRSFTPRGGTLKPSSAQSNKTNVSGIANASANFQNQSTPGGTIAYVDKDNLNKISHTGGAALNLLMHDKNFTEPVVSGQQPPLSKKNRTIREMNKKNNLINGHNPAADIVFVSKSEINEDGKHDFISGSQAVSRSTSNHINSSPDNNNSNNSNIKGTNVTPFPISIPLDKSEMKSMETSAFLRAVSAEEPKNSNYNKKNIFPNQNDSLDDVPPHLADWPVDNLGTPIIRFTRLGTPSCVDIMEVDGGREVLLVVGYESGAVACWDLSDVSYKAAKICTPLVTNRYPHLVKKGLDSQRRGKDITSVSVAPQFSSSLLPGPNPGNQTITSNAVNEKKTDLTALEEENKYPTSSELPQVDFDMPTLSSAIPNMTMATGREIIARKQPDIPGAPVRQLTVDTSTTKIFSDVVDDILVSKRESVFLDRNNAAQATHAREKLEGMMKKNLKSERMVEEALISESSTIRDIARAVSDMTSKSNSGVAPTLASPSLLTSAAAATAQGARQNLDDKGSGGLFSGGIPKGMFTCLLMFIAVNHFRRSIHPTKLDAIASKYVKPKLLWCLPSAHNGSVGSVRFVRGGNCTESPWGALKVKAVDRHFDSLCGGAASAEDMPTVITTLANSSEVRLLHRRTGALLGQLRQSVVAGYNFPFDVVRRVERERLVLARIHRTIKTKSDEKKRLLMRSALLGLPYQPTPAKKKAEAQVMSSKLQQALFKRANGENYFDLQSQSKKGDYVMQEGKDIEHNSDEDDDYEDVDEVFYTNNNNQTDKDNKTLQKETQKGLHFGLGSQKQQHASLFAAAEAREQATMKGLSSDSIFIQQQAIVDEMEDVKRPPLPRIRGFHSVHQRTSITDLPSLTSPHKFEKERFPNLEQSVGINPKFVDKIVMKQKAALDALHLSIGGDLNNAEISKSIGNQSQLKKNADESVNHVISVSAEDILTKRAYHEGRMNLDSSYNDLLYPVQDQTYQSLSAEEVEINQDRLSIHGLRRGSAVTFAEGDLSPFGNSPALNSTTTAGVIGRYSSASNHMVLPQLPSSDFSTMKSGRLYGSQSLKKLGSQLLQAVRTSSNMDEHNDDSNSLATSGQHQEINKKLNTLPTYSSLDRIMGRNNLQPLGSKLTLHQQNIRNSQRERNPVRFSSEESFAWDRLANAMENLDLGIL